MSIDEWVDRANVYTAEYIYSEYYSTVKKKKRKSCHFCDNMEGPWGHYPKWNKLEKDKCQMISYMELKNKN